MQKKVKKEKEVYEKFMSYCKTNCAGKTKHARILSFLSGQEESEYAPQSGEITGILKEMCDEMSK